MTTKAHSGLDIVCLATAWGPRHGGINAFNSDFAAGLAEVIGANGRVFCVIPNPKDTEVAAAASCGVTLIGLDGAQSGDRFDPNWVQEALRHLPTSDNRVWLGHDVISGAAAKIAAAQDGSRVALIHHMSFQDYYAAAHDGPHAQAVAKHHEQQALFRDQTLVFGVGPLLTARCSELSGISATMLVPGFPTDCAARTAPGNRVVAISTGRLDAAHDRIKQGRLVATAFGACVRDAKAFRPALP